MKAMKQETDGGDVQRGGEALEGGAVSDPRSCLSPGDTGLSQFVDFLGTGRSHRPGDRCRTGLRGGVSRSLHQRHRGATRPAAVSLVDQHSTYSQAEAGSRLAHWTGQMEKTGPVPQTRVPDPGASVQREGKC